MATFDAQIKRLILKLERTKASIGDGLETALVAIGTNAVNRLKRTTPRSSGGGPHLADGWALTIARLAPGALSVIVHNTDPRADAKIPTTSGATTLLRILEYGSRPHEITPKKPGGVLVFTARGGEVVFSKRVFHPGTRPYGMVAAARAEANLELKVALDRVRTLLRRR